jgi:anti-sigma regulatory factor (Ser/Thr protein kinase)
MALRDIRSAPAVRLVRPAVSAANGTRPDPSGGSGPRPLTSARTAHLRYFAVAAAPDAVPYARRRTRQALAAWELGDVAEDAELVVSELMTNAVLAMLELPRASQIVLYLAAGPGWLTLLVWDACPELPVRRPHGDDSAGGRGLEIVQALTSRWGSWVPVHGGKVVWARFDLDQAITPAGA